MYSNLGLSFRWTLPLRAGDDHWNCCDFIKGIFRNSYAIAQLCKRWKVFMFVVGDSPAVTALTTLILIQIHKVYPGRYLHSTQKYAYSFFKKIWEICIFIKCLIIIPMIQTEMVLCLKICTWFWVEYWKTKNCPIQAKKKFQGKILIHFWDLDLWSPMSIRLKGSRQSN